jgi:hypothetical protein
MVPIMIAIVVIAVIWYYRREIARLIDKIS